MVASNDPDLRLTVVFIVAMVVGSDVDLIVPMLVVDLVVGCDPMCMDVGNRLTAYIG